MLHSVALVKTDVSEELSSSFIRVTRIGEVGRTLAHLVFFRSVRRLLVSASVVPSSPILVSLMKDAPSSSETSVLTRAEQRNILEDTILQENTILYIHSLILLYCIMLNQLSTEATVPYTSQHTNFQWNALTSRYVTGAPRTGNTMHTIVTHCHITFHALPCRTTHNAQQYVCVCENSLV
jgi:hypothetical protein